jgi:hypothetical protein
METDMTTDTRPAPTADEMERIEMYARVENYARAEHAVAVENQTIASNAMDVAQVEANLFLTDAQKDTAVYAIASSLRKISLGRTGKAQIKSLTLVPVSRGTVQVNVTTGSVTDEGTMAAVFCREHESFFVTPRGGISVYKSTKRTAKGYTALHGKAARSYISTYASCRDSK